jgi:hypothetical protein
MDVALVAEQKGVNLCINILEMRGKTQMSPTYVNSCGKELQNGKIKKQFKELKDQLDSTELEV